MKSPSPWKTLRARLGHASGIALTYAIFLLICLSLLVCIGLTYDSRVRNDYWEQQRRHLSRVSVSMENQFQLMNDYSLQLRTDSTLLKLAAMTEETDADYVLSAYKLMQTLTARQYGLFNLPVLRSTLYLKTSNHILTSSESVSAKLYYIGTRSFRASEYDAWIALLNSATTEPTFADYSRFSGRSGDLAVLIGLSSTQLSSLPVVVTFELDTDALSSSLLPEEIEESAVFILAKDGDPLFTIGALSNETFAFDELSFDNNQNAVSGKFRLIRNQAKSGRQYYLVLPNDLANEVSGSLAWIYLTIFFVALFVGACMIVLMLRGAMKPIHQLTTRLDAAEDANAVLQNQIDAQRPAINASYLRKLLSGHVATDDEFQYMMESLHLTGDLHHYVLFCVANRQNNDGTVSLQTEYDAIVDGLERHLSGEYPLYYYVTLSREFVVLVTYSNAQTESLNDLQQRIIELHDDLSDHDGLWFYAGVGSRCVQPSRLWESYEQARSASRYTGKHHIFLPYDFILKDTQSWYYPVEISSKLYHFITSGNKSQTTDMFALIHRENVEERSLSMPLLNMLLADLKNTLFKARFQILPPQSDELAAKLHVLDVQLNSTSLSFAQLEDIALSMCDFFVRVTTPTAVIHDIEHYLQENYSDPSLCLSKVGECFNMSETYLSHLFKEKTGENFSVYLERLRMNEAAKRLTRGSCSLTTLYADLGYTNAASFRRAFKKYYGITPSEMRDGQPQQSGE